MRKNAISQRYLSEAVKDFNEVLLHAEMLLSYNA